LHNKGQLTNGGTHADTQNDICNQTNATNRKIPTETCTNYLD